MANNRKEEKKKIPVPPALPRSKSSPSSPNKGEVKKWLENGEWHSPKPTAVEPDAVRVPKPNPSKYPELMKPTSMRAAKQAAESAERSTAKSTARTVESRTARLSRAAAETKAASEREVQAALRSGSKSAAESSSGAIESAASRNARLGRVAAQLKSGANQEIKQALKGAATKEALKDVAIGSAKKLGSTIVGDVLGAFGGIAIDPQDTGGKMDSTGRYSDETQPNPGRLKKDKDARPGIAKSALVPKNKR